MSKRAAIAQRAQRAQRKRQKREEDPVEKAHRVAMAILNGRHGVYTTLCNEYPKGERAEKGHIIATNILEELGESFERLKEMSLSRKARELEFDRVCGLAKKVVHCLRVEFFGAKCNRLKILESLLEDGGYTTVFPWRVMKDDLLMRTHEKEYTKLQHDIFQCDLGSDTSSTFYLSTKERVLQWFESFNDAIRADPESVKDVLVTFCDMFCDDITPLWRLCKVEHTPDFVEEVYSECFTDYAKEEDLKHVEDWILGLGYSKEFMDGIKESLWEV